MIIFFKSAFKDLMRPGRLVIWVILAVFIVAVSYAFKMSNRGSSMTNLELYGQMADMLIFRVTALAAIVFSMSVVLQEMDQKTIIYLLTRSTSRTSICLGRTLAAALAAAIAACVGCAAGAAVLLGPAQIFSAEILKDFAAISLGAVAYTGLFTLLSMVLNRAMIIGLIFAFGWEPFVQNTSQSLNYLSVMTYMNVAADHEKAASSGGFLTALAGSAGFERPDPWVGWTVLAALAAVTIFAACKVFAVKEFSPREDDV
jgi:ABC-type transport system involved in multi-copper enzyme maturation permease subunit